MAVDPQRRRLTVGMGSAGAADMPTSGEALTSAACLSNITGQLWSLTSKTDQDKQSRKSFGIKDEEFFSKEAAAPKASEATSAAEKEAVKKMFAGHAAWSCHKGLKPESPNQDSFSMLALKVGERINYLYGVYDGHGPKGHDVSDMARKILVEKILCHAERDSNPKVALTNAFEETQKHLHSIGAVDTSTSGSTCTVAYHQAEEGLVHIAHIGDSRCVTYNRKKPADGGSTKDKWGGEAKTLPMTEDHKPNLPKEKERIEAAGGRVVFDGFYNHRVFAARGMYPGLNMSRAFGDDVAHEEAGLTASPEVITLNLKDYGDNEVVMVICSDGVWEFIESDEALSIVRPGGKDYLESIQKLCKESWDRWMKDSDNEISDDITGIFIKLQ